ncbi:GLPGLI family protein [Flavobacterium frigidarium]|jgi:GLPGLI family protein|uniref:GLPGLI family protein n=1 Tax=Flavobacterium frigidarium TaxID=99286 RepID=UPI0030DAE7B2|tara:strand:+ start:1709 stop:2368 length:660 start_codon:yes stop_codon:yes gene_type:complete
MKYIFKKVGLVILCSLFFLQSNAQSGIKVVFERQTILKEDAVKGLPEYIRERALKLVQSSKRESTMTIQGSKVYYEIIGHEQKEVGKGITKVNDPKSNVLFVSNMSVTNTYNPLKIIKDYKTNSYKEIVNNKVTTEKLPKTSWKYTNNKKIILGYSCLEAIGVYKDQPLTVYFTKALPGVASPDKLPFVNGVILEYQYGHAFGKAIKVERNQPLITKFL